MDDYGKLVTLNSSSHHDLLVRGLWKFFQKEHGVDFDFELHGGRPLRAHRLILEIFIPPEDVGSVEDAGDEGEEDETGGVEELETNNVEDQKPSQLTQEQRELKREDTNDAKELKKGTEEVDLKQAETDDVEESEADLPEDQQLGSLNLNSLVLEFMYTGSVTVPQEHLDDLLQLATELNFRLLVEVIHLTMFSARLPKGTKRSRQVDSASDEHEDERKSTDGELEVQNETTEKPKNKKQKKTKPKQLKESTPKKARGIVVELATWSETDACGEEQEVAKAPRKKLPEPTAKFESSVLYDDGVIEDVAPADDDPADGRRHRRFGCPHCDYRSHVRYRMKLHVAKHDSDAIFQCKACPAFFLNEASLAGHTTRVHANDNEDTWRCPHCDMRLAGASSLRNHCKVAHGIDASGKPVTKYACEHCQESYVYKSHLDYHVSTKHTGERPYCCTECSHRSFTMSELNVHIKFKHNQERPHVCDVCGFASVTKSNLTLHQRVHTNEKPFVCHCGKAYSRKDALNNHALQHEEGYAENRARSHMCHVCGKGYMSRNDLMGHLRRVHRLPATSKSKIQPAEPPSETSAASEDSASDWLQ